MCAWKREIASLGVRCPNCRQLEELAREPAAAVGVKATSSTVTDIQQIMTYAIVGTPALVINDAVRFFVRIPQVEEVVAWLQEAKG